MIKKLFLNDKFILFLILLNAGAIFMSGFETVIINKFYLALIDNLVTGLFFIELFIKIREYSIKGYFCSNWNKVDFVLVVLSFLSLIAFVFDINIINFSFILVLRITRVFKLFRFIKFSWAGTFT